MGALRLDRSDRVRLALIGGLTAIALPLVLAENRRSHAAGTTPDAAAVVGPAANLATGGRPAPASTDAPSTSSAGYLTGPSAPPAPLVIDIAVPGPKLTNAMSGRATFRRITSGSWVPNPCVTAAVKAGTHLTVTDLDNGHIATCINVAQLSPSAGQLVILDTGVFEQLADLVQSPVPVRITW